MNDNNRLMVRLIDVALIVLMGFIAISRLKTEYIDLPAAGNPEPQKTEIKEASLVIFGDRYELKENGRRKTMRGVDELESVLVSKNRQYENRGQKLMMNIESHKSGIMQNLVHVLDICERNEIDKSLNYDKLP